MRYCICCGFSGGIPFFTPTVYNAFAAGKSCIHVHCKLKFWRKKKRNRVAEYTGRVFKVHRNPSLGCSVLSWAGNNLGGT